MLKVVGASGWKTRMGTTILGMTMVLAIVLLIVAEMERPILNGTYCATAIWSPKAGFHIKYWGQRNDVEQIPKGVARACYKDSVMDNGWSFLEIDTQPGYPDRIQAFAAGMLEGALTWKSIHDHWTNTIESDCQKDEESQRFCAWAKELLIKNYDNIKQESEINGHHNHYWYQVRLFYHQLTGLEYGFRTGVRESREDIDIPEEDFIFLNAVSDIRDLKEYFGQFIDPQYTGGFKQKIGALFMKPMLENNKTRLIYGHSSDGSYASMIRMHKHYTFRYHLSAKHKSHIVPGSNISFTGYPGTIYSADDFYLVNGKASGFIVGGIHVGNENKALWEDVVLEDSTVMGARVMAANRLSQNGTAWCKLMSHRSGTGIKQWLVIDTKQMHHINLGKNYENDKLTAADNEVIEATEHPAEIPELNRIKESGVVWVADQLPGKLHFKDITSEIRKKGYWFSNGVPYLEDSIIMSESTKSNHKENIKTVEVLHQNITNLFELAKLFQVIGYRGDLNEENAEAFGNIDMKLYSVTSNNETDFVSYSGPMKNIPLHSYMPPQARVSVRDTAEENSLPTIIDKPVPFTWSSISYLNVQHDGQPETFDFEFTSPKWAWT